MVFHVLITIQTVAAVRNGMEAFQDGMIIKEAFVLFYLCVMVALVLANLNLEYRMNYLLRVAFLSVGSTLFCLRLMLSRVVKYWLPEALLDQIKKGHRFLKDTFSTPDSSLNFDSSVLTSMNECDDGDAMCKPATATSDDIALMLDAIMDPDRGKMFKDVAEKALVSNNSTPIYL